MSAPVEIRKYGSQQEFAVDAASMAQAGWQVATQSSGSAMTGAGSWLATIGILLLVVGFLASFPLLILGVVLCVGGAAWRQQTYTVTYRPG